MGIGVRFYIVQKKENKVLISTLQSLRNVKKIPPAWSNSPPKTKQKSPQPAPQKIVEQVKINQASIQKIIPEVSIIEKDTEELVSTMNKNMSEAKDLDLLTLDKNIEIADEIISRDPENYSAHRAKLISMLIIEGKFDQDIDNYEVASLIDRMSILEITNDSKIRREASTVSVANNQIIDLEAKLSDILQLEDQISLQSSALEKDSPEFQELQLQNSQLSAEENRISENLDLIQNYPNNELLQPVAYAEEIMEIPFLRLMAKNDYNAVIENALVHISEFPKSLSGYYFLAKALLLEGRTEDAIRAITESNLSLDAQNAIHSRIDSTAGEDPKNYWEKLAY